MISSVHRLHIVCTLYCGGDIVCTLLYCNSDIVCTLLYCSGYIIYTSLYCNIDIVCTLLYCSSDIVCTILYCGGDIVCTSLYCSDDVVCASFGIHGYVTTYTVVARFSASYVPSGVFLHSLSTITEMEFSRVDSFQNSFKSFTEVDIKYTVNDWI